MTTAKKAPAKTEEAEDDMEVEMELSTVTLEEKFKRYIPGPVAEQTKVLKSWCRENCTGKYSADKTGNIWTFMEPDDAKKFQKAWNARTTK